MPSPILHISDVCLSYGERHVLCHISQELLNNDFVVLTGPNGGGKTTLLRCLNFLETPDAGTITVQDKVLFDADPAAVGGALPGDDFYWTAE